MDSSSFGRVLAKLRKKTGSKGDYSDRDNCGRYAKTFAQANQFFDEECVNPIDPPPFTVFWFRTKKAAEKALLKLPFIHRAADSGELISELSISYGIYRVPHDTGFAAFVLGSELSLEDFEATEKAFSQHCVFKNHSLPDGAMERFKVKYNRWTKEWVHYD